jgi:hypothetical protein
MNKIYKTKKEKLFVKLACILEIIAKQFFPGSYPRLVAPGRVAIRRHEEKLCTHLGSQMKSELWN